MFFPPPPPPPPLSLSLFPSCFFGARACVCRFTLSCQTLLVREESMVGRKHVQEAQEEALSKMSRRTRWEQATIHAAALAKRRSAESFISKGPPA